MAPKPKNKNKNKQPKVAGRKAAHVAPSTSYTATGNAQIPPPQLGSEIGSGQPVPIQELVPELSSANQRLLTYARMMNDAGVDISMRAAKTPVLGAEYYVEPYSDSQDDADIAEFVEYNLFGGMSAPFLNSLEDILHMYEDGYAVLEKVYENRTWAPKRTGANGKTYTMLKKLGARPTSTIGDIVYDNNGGPTTVSQKAVQADRSTKDVKLDISKILVFTFARRGGDLTGKSLLRTAYPHWYYKTHFYKIDAIQKERHSLGVPHGKLLPGWTPADKTALAQMLRNIRSNEDAFIITPPNVEVEFAEVRGNLVDVLSSANHHNIMILMNVMAQFLALGVEGSGGGRATSGAQTDIYMKALKYVANYIVDVINMYLIPELVVWNFPSTNFPKIKVRSIGETRDLQMLAAGLSSLYAQGAITPDADTENWTRRVFDMPLKLAGSVAIDPNTHTGKSVTLYDATGAAVEAVPVAPSTNGGAPTTSQKGDVKNNGGQGNMGKNPTSAFSELSIVLPNGDVHPVEVNNEYEFGHETHISNEVVAPLPVINIHMPDGEVQQQEKPTSARIIKQDDGTTTVEYTYGESK